MWVHYILIEQWERQRKARDASRKRRFSLHFFSVNSGDWQRAPWATCKSHSAHTQRMKVTHVLTQNHQEFTNTKIFISMNIQTISVPKLNFWDELTKLLRIWSNWAVHTTRWPSLCWSRMCEWTTQLDQSTMCCQAFRGPLFAYLVESVLFLITMWGIEGVGTSSMPLPFWGFTKHWAFSHSCRLENCLFILKRK